MTTMIPPVPTPVPVADRTLQYLPVALFGSVMGLTGLASAWQHAHAHLGAPAWIAQAIGAVAVAAFVAMLAAYATKFMAAPDAVRAEFRHPIVGNLFGTAFTSALLLPAVLAPVALPVARGVWVVGTIAMLLFAWLSVDRWISGELKPEVATPAWIVPVVGLLDVPLAMPALDLPPGLQVVRLLGLAIGLFFAVPLFTLILARLIFQPPLPPTLQPTLLILLAPFSVGVSSYVVTVGRLDAFAQGLFLLSLFLLAVLAGRLRFLLRCCPFRVGWWAVSFPLASIAIAAFRMAEATPGALADAIAILLLALASGVVAWLAGRTLLGIARGELRTLSG